MSRLVWDKSGERRYEMGVRNAVLYPKSSEGTYPTGVAWNGITAINEAPSGGEPSPLYADDIKYLNLMSNEDFGGSIEAYMYPDEFAECDGSAQIAVGVMAGQQNRKEFGLCYRSIIGNDTEGDDHGYKLHIVYGCLVTPTDKNHETKNDSPEPGTMSWDFSTTPVAINGEVGGKTLRPTAHLTFDSTLMNENALKAIEDVLYGKDAVQEDQENGITAAPATDPRLPLPDEIIDIIKDATSSGNGG